jgi:hypothetical protein
MNVSPAKSSFRSALLFLTALATGFASPLFAAAYVVSNLNDAGAGSFRQAVLDADAAVGADTITFSVDGTITLATILAPLADTAGLSIDGTGHTVTISGNNAVGIFFTLPAASLTLNRLTLANASANGGALFNLGVTVISNSAFLNNAAPGGFGGAINAASGTMTIVNTTFSGNSAVGGFGGTLFSNGATLQIVNSTIVGNAQGVHNNGGGSFSVRNTIIANNTDGNCAGSAVINDGNNLDSAATCGWTNVNGSMSSTAPLVGALGANGGPTQTFALLGGSPAIDGVTFNVPNSAPANDQRGVARPQGGAYDIGAYEVAVLVPAGPVVPVPTLNVWILVGVMAAAMGVALRRRQG